MVPMSKARVSLWRLEILVGAFNDVSTKAALEAAAPSIRQDSTKLYTVSTDSGEDGVSTDFMYRMYMNKLLDLSCNGLSARFWHALIKTFRAASAPSASAIVRATVL